jgi:uncharacterized membrane protein (DUF2068 family)
MAPIQQRRTSGREVRRESVAMPQHSKRTAGAKGLFVIAGFKLLNGVLLIFATMAIVHLFNKNVPAHAESWLDFFRIDSDNQYVSAALWRLRLVHTHQLKAVALLSSFYAALFLTEGVGLVMQQRWAEYLVIVATGLFIPLELYELCKGPSAVKIALLLINCAVVVYVTILVRRKVA